MKDTTKCPKCGTSPCYIGIGFSGKIECSNIECFYYSEDLYPITKEKNEEMDDELRSYLEEKNIFADDNEFEKIKKEIEETWGEFQLDLPIKVF